MEKRCLACFEQINAQALKCPKCHQVQTRIANLPNKPIVTWTIMGLLSAILVWILYFVVTAILKDYGYQSEVKGEAGTVHTAVIRDRDVLTCIGNLTNTGDTPWGDLSVEAKFYDKNGKLIDVLHTTESDIRIASRIVTGFRVRGEPSANPESYATCKLRVIDAS